MGAADLGELVEAWTACGDAAAVPYLRGWLSARAAEPASPVSARRALVEAEEYLRRHSQPPGSSGLGEVAQGGRR